MWTFLPIHDYVPLLSGCRRDPSVVERGKLLVTARELTVLCLYRCLDVRRAGA